MRQDIIQHKFIEFGKHRSQTDSGKIVQHLYGIKSESVLQVIEDGYMCILDVHPQVTTPTLTGTSALHCSIYRH